MLFTESFVNWNLYTVEDTTDCGNYCVADVDFVSTISLSITSSWREIAGTVSNFGFDGTRVVDVNRTDKRIVVRDINHNPIFVLLPVSEKHKSMVTL